MSEMREKVEERRDQMTAGPQEPQFEQMEAVARESKQHEQQNPDWTQGQDIPIEDVPEDERQQSPVGTETINY
jgi:hypothetical protein